MQDSYQNNSESSQEVSKYNEASLQIMRLHELWLEAENYSRKALLLKWKFVLDSVWRELFSDISKLPQTSSYFKRNHSLKIKIINSKTKNELYYNLEKRHEFLKTIQDKCGKGGVYQALDSEDFD